MEDDDIVARPGNNDCITSFTSGRYSNHTGYKTTFKKPSKTVVCLLSCDQRAQYERALTSRETTAIVWGEGGSSEREALSPPSAVSPDGDVLSVLVFRLPMLAHCRDS